MSERDTRLLPLGNRVLVEILSDEEKVGNLTVLNAHGDYSKGVILELPPEYGSLPQGAGRDLNIGDQILFHKGAEEIASVGENRFFVPLGAIAAVCQSHLSPSDADAHNIFKLPAWGDFISNGELLDSFKEWQNIKSITFRTRFLEPFRDLLPLAQRMYEHCHHAIRPHVEDNFDAFKLEVQEDRKNSLQDNSIALVKCDDDYWNGNLVLHGKERFFDFTRNNVDLRTIVETMPVWMAAYSRTLMDPLFRQATGADYRRITFASLNIEQLIRLEDRGGRNPNIRNCNSMGHFIRFGLTSGEAEMSPTLKQFGLDCPLEESIGRVDVKFSYNRKIGSRDRPFKVWFNASAPMNDKAKLLHVDWEIQDIYPENILDQQYGVILHQFFRDVVLRGVYNTWFENITCSTDR